MEINVISKDDNNFKLQITNLDLPLDTIMNYINRSKALMDNEYGKYSIIFKFEIASNQEDVTVLIPNGYYDRLGQIKSLLTKAFISLENPYET